MSVSVPNPYTGKNDETCSASFVAQQQYLGGASVHNAQSEAQYNTSKILGEFGVLFGKAKSGQVPAGTKLLSYTNKSGARGYYYWGKDGEIHRKHYGTTGGPPYDTISNEKAVELVIKHSDYSVSIPQAVGKKIEHSGPTTVAADAKWGQDKDVDFQLKQDDIVAVKQDGSYIFWDASKFNFKEVDKYGVQKPGSIGSLEKKLANEKDWLVPDSPADIKPKVVNPVTNVKPPLAAPTPAPAVNTGSASVGSMSNEDVSAMFVSIKDDLAKQKGLNIKGANAALDQEVYDAIGAKTGYTGAEVKAKIDAYKADGNKLSALKKKVLSGTKKVPNPTPVTVPPVGASTAPKMTSKAFDDIWAAAKAGQYANGTKVLTFSNNKGDHGWVSYDNGQLTTYILSPDKQPFKTKTQKIVIDDWVKSSSVKVDDLKPVKANAFPTPASTADAPSVPTTKLVEDVKAAVETKVAATPGKHYSDEDLAAQYIIAKDAVVAASNGKFTLYSKSDELDDLIYGKVQAVTGVDKLGTQTAVANYLGSGKKLSVLKKQLAKQGAFDPKADTLKKSGSAKTAEEKATDVAAKAAAGYTPTSTPATTAKSTDPPIDTGKPAPRAVAKEDAKAGTIDQFTDQEKASLYSHYKSQGYGAYLSSTSGENYDTIALLQGYYKGKGKDYTLLQIIRIIDSEGAKKFKADNTFALEKKLVPWLASPDGTSHIKTSEQKLADKLKAAELAAKKAEELAAKKAEAEKLAKELEGKQPPLPADSALFDPDMNEAKSFEVQQAMLAAKPFGPRERAAIVHYTSNAYTEMNRYLRGQSTSISDRSKNANRDAQAGMRPNTKPMIVRRGTGASQFQSLGVSNGDVSLLWGITGKRFKDEGFLSTSSAGRAAFGGEVAMEIELPVGAPAMYVDYEKLADGTIKKFSRYPGEKEMLLGRGMTYKILNVRKEGSTYVVRARVVDWPGKEN